MAQTQSPSHASVETASHERQIATPAKVQAFTLVIEADERICPNCFGVREPEHRHFRSSGGRATGQAPGDDRTADRFCSDCWAGTGERDLWRGHEDVDYSNVTCHLPHRYIRDMGGTLAREWGEDAPLPKNGEYISFFRNLGRLSDRLTERHYLHDRERLLDRGETLKTHFPSEDWKVFARLVGEIVGDVSHRI